MKRRERVPKPAVPLTDRVTPSRNSPERRAIEFLNGHVGQPLEPAIRNSFEPQFGRSLVAAPEIARSGGGRVPPQATAALAPAFGHDFSRVRIFADDAADSLARSAEASALTIGQDVFFARGAYEIESPGGFHRLAHELAHTVQQRDAQGPATTTLAADASAERDARAAADAALMGDPVSLGAGQAAGAVVAREEEAAKQTEAEKAALLVGQFPWMRAFFPNYTTTVSGKGLQAQKTDGMTTTTRTADVSLANGGSATIGQRRITEADKDTSMESSQKVGYADGAAYVEYGSAGKSLADDKTKVADSQTTRITTGPDTLGVKRASSTTRDTVTNSSEGEVMLKDGKIDASYKREREFELDKDNKLGSGTGVKVGSEGASVERTTSSRIKDAETGAIDSTKTSKNIGYSAKEGVTAGYSSEKSTEINGQTFTTGTSAKVGADSASFTRTKSQTSVDEQGNKQTDTRATTVGINKDGATIGQVHTDAAGNTTAMSATGNMSVDAQGNLTSVSLSGSYTRNGKTVSAGAGYDIHVTEPRKVGDVYVVEWERVFSAHAAGGAKGVSVSGEYDSKRFGSRAFPTEAAAKAFYDQAESMGASLAIDPTSISDAQKLAVGETRGAGDSSKVGAAGGVPMAGGGSIGGSYEHGSSSSIEVRRVSETVFDLTRDGSSVSGHGISASTLGGIGASRKSSGSEGVRITVRVDTSTEVGRVAYNLYAKNGIVIPPAQIIGDTEYEASTSSQTAGFGSVASSTWSGHTEHSVSHEAAGTTERFAGETSQVETSKYLPKSIGGYDTDMGVRLDEAEKGGKNYYALTGHVHDERGEDSARDLAEITGMNRDVTQGEIKPSGAWNIEVEITPEMVEQFLNTVSEEKIQEEGIFQSASARNELRKALAEAKTPAEKKRALAQFFSEGFEGRAIRAMRNELWGVKNQWAMNTDYESRVKNQRGNFEYDLSLPNDKNFRGTEGRLELEGKIDKFTKAIADNPAGAGALHGQIYAKLEDVRRQRSEVADPQRYTDLPRQLREQQVARLDKYIAQLSELATQASVAFTAADAAAAPEPEKHDAKKHGKDHTKPAHHEADAPKDPRLKALAALRAKIGSTDQSLQKSRADYEVAETMEKDYVKQFLHVINGRSREAVHKAYEDNHQFEKEALALKASAIPQQVTANELRSQFIEALANPDAAEGIAPTLLAQLALTQSLWAQALDKMNDATRPLRDIVEE
jgi:hypothetical protein